MACSLPDALEELRRHFDYAVSICTFEYKNGTNNINFNAGSSGQGIIGKF